MLTFSWKGLGQEPTYSLSLYSGFSGCQNGNLFGCGISGDNNEIFSNDNDNNGNKVIQNIPKYTNFTLSLNSACEGEVNNSRSCSFDKFIVEKDSELIKGKFISLAGCHGHIRITGFKPNVTITNQKSTTVCSGEELNLQGFPARFPNEAYHWQYSFDGTTNWIDVSNKINARELNNTHTTRFSIYEILGKEHEKYFDKPIYFRLGYGQDRPFTEPLAIMYNSCAPVIKNVDYKPPICNGDAIQKVEVTFNRPLNPGESLDRIKMKDVGNGLEINERTDITIFSLNNPYKYLFTGINPLENGRTYKIVYQAQIEDPLDPKKKIMKGFLESPKELDFTYKDPVKLTFKITKQTPPSCFGGEDGSIEIMVTSGVPLYRFYLDRVELKDQLYPKLIDGKYHILGLKANPKGYKIKVTDTNGCIEKTTP
jgi:hypothetical protein